MVRNRAVLLGVMDEVRHRGTRILKWPLYRLGPIPESRLAEDAPHHATNRHLGSYTRPRRVIGRGRNGTPVLELQSEGREDVLAICMPHGLGPGHANGKGQTSVTRREVDVTLSAYLLAWGGCNLQQLHESDGGNACLGKAAEEAQHSPAQVSGSEGSPLCHWRRDPSAVPAGTLSRAETGVIWSATLISGARLLACGARSLPAL